MSIPIVTHPITGIPWQPSKRQVIAAAMAVGRHTVETWNRLDQSTRDDLMIDGHAVIVAAYRQSPQDAFADHSGRGDVGDMVSMTKAHADAYTALLNAAGDYVDGVHVDPEPGTRLGELAVAIARLRALASPERTTP